MRTSLVSVALIFSLTAASRGDEKITLVVPEIQCNECAKTITDQLNLARATVGGITQGTKKVPITYDPSKMTLHQVTQVVFDTPPVHPGRYYRPWILLEVEGLDKRGSKLKTVRRFARAINKYTIVDLATGQVGLQLNPLTKKTKATEYLTLAKLNEGFTKAGLKLKRLAGKKSGKNSGKKDAATKKDSAKAESKRGKPKTAASDSKPKKPRKVASTAPKTPKPRFQILGAGKEKVFGDKVFLIDNEADPKIRKWVKAGDSFGSFVVKQVKDGNRVILEDPKTNKKIEVAKPKK